MCVSSSTEQGKIKLFKTEVNYVKRSSNDINKCILRLEEFIVTGRFLRYISECKRYTWTLHCDLLSSLLYLHKVNIHYFSVLHLNDSSIHRILIFTTISHCFLHTIIIKEHWDNIIFTHLQFYSWTVLSKFEKQIH